MKFRSVLAVLALVAAMFGAIGSTASAAPGAAPAAPAATVFFQIRAQHSGKCLDVRGGTGATGDGVDVQQWTCLGTSQTNQLWRLLDSGNGIYRVVALNSGKCLDVRGGTGATGDGVQVQQWTCLGDNQTNQRWRIEWMGGNYYNFRAVHSNKCLDIAGGPGATGDGARAIQWTCLGVNQTNQKFYLISS